MIEQTSIYSPINISSTTFITSGTMDITSLRVPDLVSQGLDIPYPEDKVLLDYVYVTNNRFNLQHKTKVVEKEPKSLEEVPNWYNNAFDTEEFIDPRPELYMKPAAMFKDPFRKGQHKIILCELLNAKDKTPVVVNTRAQLRALTERPDVSADKPWCGWEQEFFITDDNGLPLGWDFSPTSVDNWRHAAIDIGNNAGFERSLTEYHLKACLYAGLTIFGTNREECSAQWEYQTGPGDCLDMADQLVISRYLLMRCAEIYGVHVSFKAKVAPSSGWPNGCHMNFSTEKMRQEGGLKYIMEAITKISNVPQEKILPSFDRNNGEDNKKRMTGDFFTPSWDKFSAGTADKSCSVRVPPQVANAGKGYLEERRPCGDCDPYTVMTSYLKMLYKDEI